MPIGLFLIAVAASIYGWALIATTVTHPGAIGLNLDALGTDWMVFHSGARRFFSGQMAGLYDGDAFTAQLNRTFADWLSAPLPFRPFVYPPSYLLLILPFGALPFLSSYIAFQAVTAVLLGVALWFGADRPGWRGLVIGGALLGPAAAINVAVGQNAFLIAALLVAGMRLLPVKPALGGFLLGVLTVKPQFWLLVPVALLAAREWRALGWSVLAGLMLAVASALVLGLGPWREWLNLALGSYATPDAKWIEYGRMWGVSVDACLASIGLPAALANTGQMLAILVAGALTYAVFSRDEAADRKLAVLLAATVLAAPHVSLHDLVLLTLAGLLWVVDAVHRPRSLGEWTMALALGFVPLFGPPLVSPVARLTPLLILGFAALVLTDGGMLRVTRAAIWGDETRAILDKRR
jgi:alpha-1,2-mannosyltransferase